MKKSILTAGLVLTGLIMQVSASIVPMPGNMSLGSDGDSSVVNGAVPGTYIYGRNSVVMTNSAGVLNVYTGANAFDAVSLGKGNVDPNHATDHSFAVSAGDAVSFVFDFRGANSGLTATPTFQIRLNEGNNSQGERLSVAPTATDIGGGVMRYELTNYVIPQPGGSETVDRMDVFISFGTGQGFTNSEYVGDIIAASVIPEPATMGLVAAFGGAVLFIRRRFMI